VAVPKHERKMRERERETVRASVEVEHSKRKERSAFYLFIYSVRLPSNAIEG